MIIPRGLRPGDLVAVIAPSSPFEAALGWRGLGFLATRYRLKFNRDLFSRSGYLAGSDARRKNELREALEDPSVSAILAARGGYGASRFVHELDFSVLRDRPKWIVGFSDVTALHVEATRIGVASLHASHLTSLGRGDDKLRRSMVLAFEEPLRKRSLTGLRTIVEGEASGLLFGGNLTLLHACAAAGRLSVPEGAILFIEDVTERPYRIDRMLTTLLVGGHLRNVSGILLGEFTGCDPGIDRITTIQVLEERLGALGVPVVDGLRSGHGDRNEPLVIGGPARLFAGRESAHVELG